MPHRRVLAKRYSQFLRESGECRGKILSKVDSVAELSARCSEVGSEAEGPKSGFAQLTSRQNGVSWRLVVYCAFISGAHRGQLIYPANDP